MSYCLIGTSYFYIDGNSSQIVGNAFVWCCSADGLNDIKQTRECFFKTVRLESAHSFVNWIGSSCLKSSDIPSSRKLSRSCIDELF